MRNSQAAAAKLGGKVLHEDGYRTTILIAAKVMAWLGIIQTSINREIKRLDVRLSETAEAVRRQSNS